MSQFVGWEGDRLVVRFRYRVDLKDQVKAIQGARFEWDKKYWWFSKADALAALPALERAGFDVSAARAGGDETIELPPEPEHVGICALNAEVARALQRSFPTPRWVVGEVQDCKPGRAQRHLYLSLVERGADERVAAKVSCVMFANTRARVERKLAAQGLEIQDEVQVRVLVRVQVYEAQGRYQLLVEDIDPNYSAGELARRREEVVRAVREAGLADANRGLPWPTLPLRVALLTSAGSDAYHDVLSSLGASGYGFLVDAYDVRVQGDGLAPTVLRALAAVSARASRYDAVIVTRGGGSRVELSAWDDLEVALALARCPVKALVAIGHEQDTSALDELAESYKTPTAAGEALVARVASVEELLTHQRERLARAAEHRVHAERSRALAAARAIRAGARVAVAGERVHEVAGRMRRALQVALEQATSRERRAAQRLRPERFIARSRRASDALDALGARLSERTLSGVAAEGACLVQVEARLCRDAPRALSEAGRELEHLEARVRLADPIHVLRRGFAWVRGADGRSITSASSPPERARVVFHDGAWGVQVESVEEEP